MEHLSLIAGAQEPSREVWEKAAADVLRTAGRMASDDPDSLVSAKLAHTTLDGIEVSPLSTSESVLGLPDPGLPGRPPYTRGSGVAPGWDVRAWLADPDARRAAGDAVTDLENGATSLWVTLGRGGTPVGELSTVLEPVYLDLAPVVLDCPEDPVAAAEVFAALLEDRGVRPAPGTSLGGDPIGARVAGRATVAAGRAATSPADVEVTVRRLSHTARRLGVTALVVDGTAVHDQGATDAQELGYSVAVGVTYLRLLADIGVEVEEAAGLVEFRYAVTDEQFPSIAKLRAARRLWHRVLALSGAPEAPGQVQHAVTSRAMTTKYDPWVNLVRGTVAAFSAGIGGAASVTVLPFDTALGLPDALGRRIARNTSSLLLHESHVGMVTDPAGGSYLTERLTEDLARAGWAELQRIEAEGGIASSIEHDTGILDRVLRRGEERWRAVARRERPVTGVSEFPNLHERLPARAAPPQDARTAAPGRYARWFEELRDEPSLPPVLVATMGSVAQHSTRAGFAANLLAAGGVHSVLTGATATVEDVLAAYDGHRVVCLAGTDAAYAEWGSELVRALRGAGASYVVLAGRPGDRTVPEDLLDDSCASGIDAIAFLHRVRDAMGAEQ